MTIESITDFNWRLMLSLVTASIPGALILIPFISKLINTYEPPSGRKIPPRPVLRLLVVMQTLVLVAIAAAIGTALAPRVGLRAPAFEALADGRSALDALLPQIGPALLLGIIGGALFVLAYYRIFRPRLSSEEIRITEGFRMNMGLAGRVLYGGVVEEILMRWGLMSLFVWLGAALFGSSSAGVVWLAIVISGVLFALRHLPGLIVQGLKVTGPVLAANIALNLGAALIFGWLFWQAGLEAAMLAHATFHVIWYPLEVRYNRGSETPSHKVTKTQSPEGDRRKLGVLVPWW